MSLIRLMVKSVIRASSCPCGEISSMLTVSVSPESPASSTSTWQWTTRVSGAKTRRLR